MSTLGTSPELERVPGPSGSGAFDARRAQGVAALVVVQLCFGLFPLFVKLASGAAALTAEPSGAGFGPRAIAFWRILVGSAFLAVVALRAHGRRCVPSGRDLARLAACAVLGIAVNQVFAMEGIARTSVVDAGLLFTTIPVFTYGIALAVRQERYRPRRALGIALALTGAALLVLRRGAPGGEHPDALVGNLLLVFNCLSYAAYLVLARPLLRRHPPLVVTAWVFVLSLWTLPWIAWGQVLAPEVVARDEWIGMGYTLVFATIVAYVLNTYALERVSASTTAAFVYLQPLISGAAGVALLGERITATAGLAAALLLAGITLVVRSPAVAGPAEGAPAGHRASR